MENLDVERKIIFEMDIVKMDWESVDWNDLTHDRNNVDNLRTS